MSTENKKEKCEKMKNEISKRQMKIVLDEEIGIMNLKKQKVMK